MPKGRKRKRSGITEVMPGKLYYVRPYYGKDAITNKPVRGKQITVHGTYKDACKVLDEQIAAHDSGLRLDADKLLFSTLANDWLSSRELEGKAKNRTLAHNRTMLARILPTLGNARVADIRPEHCELLLKVNKDDGMSNTTLHHIGLVLSQVLNRAVDFGYILRNPNAKVRWPKPDKSEARYLTADQSAHLLTCIDSKEREAMGGICELLAFGRLLAIRLGLATGARPGELLVMEWRDFDFRRRTVTIRGTKTANSWRTIPVDPSTLAMLQGWQNYQRQRLEGYGIISGLSTPVCCNSVGKTIGISNFEHWFRGFADSCGYEWLTPHCLRHTVATQWIMNGVDVKTVSYRLGHKDIKTTCNIYAHVLEEKHADHSSRMAVVIGLDNAENSVFANSLPISEQRNRFTTQARQAKYAV